MLDRHLRAVKDRWLAPAARLLGPGVPPTAITLIGLAAGLGSAGAAATGSTGAALGLWFLNRILDGLDGAHARLHQRGTAFGAYLDIVLDFVVYAAIPMGIAIHAGTRAMALATALLLAAFYVNAASWMYLSALLEQRRAGAAARHETPVTIPPGVIGGTETVAFYVAFFLWPSLQYALFLLMAALVLLNVPVRLVWARRQL